ncbi:hypothetical protein A5N78_04675 [Prescottella equi]|uniref:hypothetical protein n=1 Tax=Rhodococcus hoagii TaxID=43767 RepID=UPI000A0F88EA|nr:hypothetical protein [Prescottella equi]ORL93433.1 hypothetical protein A5N78_04675 [Prescottella equi]ORM17786.1 hypothetical protein A5N70_11250 [Prescottella equi]
MERVWLSTSYYLDPSVLSLSEGAEVLFVRIIAYCGAAETLGIVTETALKTLGIRALNRKKSELLASGLLHEIEPGTYRLKGWERWQKNGDDLVKRRKGDRERKARQRAREAEESRDMSRDVTGGEESRREENRTTYVGSAPPVSSADAKRRRGLAIADALNETARPAAVYRFMHDYRQSRAAPIDERTLAGIENAITPLVVAGIPTEQIAAGIRAWEASDSFSPTQIAAFVHKAGANSAAPAPTLSKAQQWIDLANDFARTEPAPPRKELT